MFGVPALTAGWRAGTGAAVAAGGAAAPSPAPGVGDHPRVEVAAVISMLRKLAGLPPPSAVEAKLSGVGAAVLEVCRHPIPLLAGAACTLLRRWRDAAVDRSMMLAVREKVRGRGWG